MRVNVALMDEVFAKTSDKLCSAFKDRVPMGPVSGIIRHHFVLLGKQEKARNSLGLIDRK